MLAINCNVKSICRIATVRGCDQYIAAITSITKQNILYTLCYYFLDSRVSKWFTAFQSVLCGYVNKAAVDRMWGRI